MKLYKITLMDENIPAFCSGGAYFFTEDIEEFEREWLPHAYDEQKERYQKSKAGECITDTWRDDPEDSIFQIDEHAEMLRRVVYTESDCHYKLLNAYGWPTDIYADKSRIEVASVRFRQSCYLIGKYRLEGVCQESLFSKEGTAESYERIHLWGNPVFRKKLYSGIKEYYSRPEPTELVGFPRSEFTRDVVETYCWICLGKRERPFLKKDMKLTRKLIIALMCDIPGEAG
ncbi:MAG: hypothetical protein LUG93_04835 [Lachnospiraceae bacterium]|nr:hypothetical protein [Lachnospiraceae bacterium]